MIYFNTLPKVTTNIGVVTGVYVSNDDFDDNR